MERNIQQNGIRLPKWFVVLLLVASPLLLVVVMAWFWTVWPRETAREFAAAVVDRDEKQIARSLAPAVGQEFGSNWLGKHEITVSKEPVIEWVSRDAHDLLTGRQRFVLRNLPLTFTAQSGSITAERCRTISLAVNETMTLTLREYAKRVSVDDPQGVDVRVSKTNPAEVRLVGRRPSGALSVQFTDRTGSVYDVKVRVSN